MRKVGIVASALLAVGLLALATARFVRSPPRALPVPRIDETYAKAIQPIFDHRCVVCHSCFDSPCQLNLQSFEGLDRGATTTRVYESDRLTAIHPTRMFEDAQTTAEWVDHFGFFPVVIRDDSTLASPERSLLWRAIDQRRRAPVPVAVDVDSATTCPVDISALDRELGSDPGKGMPYGFPPLTDGDAQAIRDWLGRGAGRSSPAPESDATLAEIARW